MMKLKTYIQIFKSFSVNFTVIACSEDKVFTECATVCEQTCRSIGMERQVCQTACHPGCACPEGLYLTEEDTCVEVQDCGCYYDGKMYEAGEKFIRKGHTW